MQNKVDKHLHIAYNIHNNKNNTVFYERGKSYVHHIKSVLTESLVHSENRSQKPCGGWRNYSGRREFHSPERSELSEIRKHLHQQFWRGREQVNHRAELIFSVRRWRALWKIQRIRFDPGRTLQKRLAAFPKQTQHRMGGLHG